MTNVTNAGVTMEAFFAGMTSSIAQMKSLEEDLSSSKALKVI